MVVIVTVHESKCASRWRSSGVLADLCQLWGMRKNLLADEMSVKAGFDDWQLVVPVPGRGVEWQSR